MAEVTAVPKKVNIARFRFMNNRMSSMLHWHLSAYLFAVGDLWSLVVNLVVHFKGEGKEIKDKNKK